MQPRCASGPALCRCSWPRSWGGGDRATASGPWVSEFSTGLTPSIGLWDIAPGADGNLWFTEETNNGVADTPGAIITEFTAGFPPAARAGSSGPDGNVWVAQAGGDGAIARVTPAAWSRSSGPTPGDPWDIAAGPDGNLWYVDPTANVIGRITRDGSITEFTAGLDPAAEPNAIAGSRRQALVHREGHRPDRQDQHRRDDHGVHLRAVGERRAHGHRHRARRQTLVHAQRRPGRDRPDHDTGNVTIFSDGLTPNSRPVGIARARTMRSGSPSRLERRHRPNHDRRRDHGVHGRPAPSRRG